MLHHSNKILFWSFISEVIFLTVLPLQIVITFCVVLSVKKNMLQCHSFCRFSFYHPHASSTLFVTSVHSLLQSFNCRRVLYQLQWLHFFILLHKVGDFLIVDRHFCESKSEFFRNFFYGIKNRHDNHFSHSLFSMFTAQNFSKMERSRHPFSQ